MSWIFDFGPQIGDALRSWVEVQAYRAGTERLNAVLVCSGLVFLVLSVSAVLIISIIKDS